MNDPYVEEVRKHRMEHTQAFGGDLHRICEDLRLFESTLGDRVVSLNPKKIRQRITNKVREEREEYRADKE